MDILTSAALQSFGSMTRPEAVDTEAILETIYSGAGYWEERRNVIAALIQGAQLIPGVVDEILEGEAFGPGEHQHLQYVEKKRLALDAVRLDQSMLPAVVLHHLIAIETGKDSPGGYISHQEAVNQILKHVADEAKGGLVLRLDYTIPEGAEFRRRLRTATPYLLDLGHLASYKFEMNRGDSASFAGDPQLLSDEAGLYLRYAPEAQRWRQDNNYAYEVGVQAYGLPQVRSGLLEWSRYPSGWSSSLYPDRGPAMLFGRANIMQHITERMSYGGQRLLKIMSDVGQYPGFGFIHEIEPTGEQRSDVEDVEGWGPAVES